VAVTDDSRSPQKRGICARTLESKIKSKANYIIFFPGILHHLPDCSLSLLESQLQLSISIQRTHPLFAMPRNNASYSNLFDCEDCLRFMESIRRTRRPPTTRSSCRRIDHLRARVALLAELINVLGEQFEALLRSPPPPPNPLFNLLTRLGPVKSFIVLMPKPIIVRLCSYIHVLYHSGRAIGFAVVSTVCRSDKIFVRVIIRLVGQPVMTGKFGCTEEAGVYVQSVLNASGARAARSAVGSNAVKR
jgi:hypothetical protein